MTTVGSTDAFERRYTAEFKARAAPFGEFVFYERDRAARDLGVHLSRPAAGDAETMSSSLCWFQLKGVQATTLPKAKAEKASEFTLSVAVEHLRFWYLQPDPTWLAYYVESLDQFFVVNVKDYVAANWGDEILSLGQTTATVKIRHDSVLDKQAFSLILRFGELPVWARVTNAPLEDLSLIQRDAGLVWRLGTAKDRQVEHLLKVFDWQSKSRGEVYFFERPIGSDQWNEIREHWQLALTADGVSRVYPYLTLEPTDESAEPDYDDEYQPRFALPDGTLVYGKDASGEYHLYELVPRLNDLGLRLHATLERLRQRGLITLSPDAVDSIDIAPWHKRDV